MIFFFFLLNGIFIYERPKRLAMTGIALKSFIFNGLRIFVKIRFKSCCPHHKTLAVARVFIFRVAFRVA